MGRPRGSKNKKTLAKMGVLPPSPAVDKRSDAEVLETIVERFDVFYRMIVATTQNAISSLVVSGSAGVGKSYTAEWALEVTKARRPDLKYQIVRGAVSAIGLYETALNMANPSNVLVLDDADRIFDDEDGLNLLKSMLDTSQTRKVSWITDHSLFKGPGALPREFEYKGSCVFLTNKDFQGYMDRGVGRYVEHMEALMSRSIYLDLKMHSRREVGLWMKHLVTKKQILQGAPLYLTAEQEKTSVDWVMTHRENLRELSIRTALKLGAIMKMAPDKWEKTAEITLLKDRRGI